MSGIAGRVNHDGRPVPPSILHEMNNVQRHRGPDFANIFVEGGVGLAYCHRSTLDGFDFAEQPATNEDQSVHVICDGEVYNRGELRQQMESRSHKFRGDSVAELIAHLYEEYGTSFVAKLRGMFAVAIWDSSKRTLVLARDKLGVKPLYYSLAGSDLIFGSEIKAIMKDPDVIARVNLEAIHHYLTYQYVPSPLTAFEGIDKLPAAHVLVWKEGGTRMERYWTLSYRDKLRMTEDVVAEHLVEMLEESVRLRMDTGGSIGAFLSGGIDSSATVAMMARLSDRPVKTFSIGFEEKEYNELKFAKQIADRFGTDHHTYVVKPDTVSLLPRLVWHYEEPFSDSSAVPSFIAAQETSRHVNVVITGDGADESFAGYQRYVANLLGQKAEAAPRFLRVALSNVLKRVPVAGSRTSFVNRLKKFGENLAYSPEYRYGRWMSHFTHDAKRRLYSPSMWSQFEAQDSLEMLLKLYEESDGTDILDRTLDVDVQSYLAGDLLVKVGVACMANSLQDRAPFLDERIVEFAATIPSDMKIKGGETKYILKKALSRHLPDEILYRPKMGFGVPIDIWFRGELKELAYDTLLSDAATGRRYFNMSYVKNLLDAHVSGRENNQYQIWSLLMLELWHQTFIDQTI